LSLRLFQSFRSEPRQTRVQMVAEIRRCLSTLTDEQLAAFYDACTDAEQKQLDAWITAEPVPEIQH